MPAFSQEHLKQYCFKHLFNELGWDAPDQQQPYSVAVDDDTWLLDVVALKKGVQVLHCHPGAQGGLPDYANRQKIECKITPGVREHPIVFNNQAKTFQAWQWVTRLAGKCQPKVEMSPFPQSRDVPLDGERDVLVMSR